MKASLLLLSGLCLAVDLSAQTQEKPATVGAVASGAAVVATKVVITSVHSEGQLLAIVEDLGRVKGVHDVRRLGFERKTNEALLEIVAGPEAQAYWRAHLESLSKRKTKAQEKKNNARDKYPSWFQPPSSK